jgi:hypothetical protein
MTDDDKKVYGFYGQDVKRIGKALRAVEAGRTPGGTAGSELQGQQVIVAKLTSRDSTDKRFYAWSQVRRAGTGWDVITGGLSGTVGATPSVPAVDPSLATSTTGGSDLSNTYVLLVRGNYSTTAGSGTAANLRPCFYIAGALSFPTPRPIYSVLMPINSSGDLAFSRPRLT